MTNEQLTATLAMLYRQCIEGIRKHEPHEMWQRRLLAIRELQEHVESFALDATNSNDERRER